MKNCQIESRIARFWERAAWFTRKSLMLLLAHKKRAICHGCSFVKSDGSESLTVALLKRATRANLSQSPCLCPLIMKRQADSALFYTPIAYLHRNLLGGKKNRQWGYLKKEKWLAFWNIKMFSLGKTAGVSNRVKEKFLGNLLTQYLTPALAMALFV